MFDICVEALSDKERLDIERDRVTKKAEYAAGGVPEYYILRRQSNMQAFFARGSDGLYAPIEPIDGLIRSRVLTGLQFRLDDLRRQPDLDAMRNDPVYQTFVLPEWRDAEQRAEAEAQRAEAEAQRAEEAIRARQSAERRAQATEKELARLREKLSGTHPSS